MTMPFARQTASVPTGSLYLQKNVQSSLGLRTPVAELQPRNSFGVATDLLMTFLPRVAKAQPWAEISERFQRYT